MSRDIDPKRVVTGRVRLSYVHLTTPRPPQQGGTPKFSVTLLIPKADVATRQRIDAAINAAIQEGTASKWTGVRPPQPALPVYDGDGVRPNGEAFGEEYKGHWVMTASSEQRPEVVDLNLNPIVAPTEIYSGMYARVSIRFFAYANSGKKGIGCGLGNVQKLEDGKPLSGHASAASDFGTLTPVAPAYQPPAPVYPVQPMYPPGYQPAPAYPQQPVYVPLPPMAAPAAPLDPITGKPTVSGAVFGLQ